MSYRVIIARDFDHMSEIASNTLIDDIGETLSRKGGYVLGLATGNTPTGLYKHLAKAANGGRFDSSGIRSFNLDEYVGLPGENAQQRALHPESYSFFMVQELFSLLQKKFAETNVPWGTLVDQDRLAKEMKTGPSDWKMAGRDAGKAVVIEAGARSEYLRWVREQVLDAYERKIERVGGIDLHVIGVGQRGHVGFHEAGIPFEGNSMLLVKLDDNTVENAVKDGHFATRAESPEYAVSMGAALIFKARTVLLMASGRRKADTMLKAMRMEPDCSVPVSYGQTYSKNGGRLVCVLDKAAAAGVLANLAAVKQRGIEVEDVSGQSASVKVQDLCFCRNPDTGLMG